MNRVQADAERAVNDLFKEFGAFDVNAKDVQRVKEAEKAARKRATNEAAGKGRSLLEQDPGADRPRVPE